MLVFPETTIYRSLPRNIQLGDRHIYKGSLIGKALPCELLTLQNISFNHELLLLQDGTILKDSFAWPSHIESYQPWKEKVKFVIKNHFLRKKIFVEKPVLWCLNNYATGGFYHWLSEVLPRLWVAKEHLPQCMLALPDYFLERWPFIRETLQAFGSPEILVIDSRRLYHAETIILPTQTGGACNYHFKPIQEVAKTLKAHFGLPSFKLDTSKIYISRKHSKHRKVTNEEEILPLLAKNDFKVIYFEHLDFQAQINICMNATHLIGIHGAGLTNSMFLSPKSRMLEMRTPEPLDWLNCFYTLADVFSIDYYYLLGTPTNHQHPYEDRPDDKSLYIDPIEFAKVLELFLA